MENVNEIIKIKYEKYWDYLTHNKIGPRTTESYRIITQISMTEIIAINFYRILKDGIR